MRGKEIIEYDNPYDVGMTGLLGFSSGYHAMDQCDTLLMLGTDFPYREFYPRTRRCSKSTCAASTSAGGPCRRAAGRDSQRHRCRPAPPGEAEGRQRTPGADATALRHGPRAPRRPGGQRPQCTPLHPQFVAKTVDEVAAEDAVFLPDVGTPVVWAARYLRMNGRRRLIGSFSHGTMANALPQAIGVQAAQPGRQVVALSGDGGLAMLFGELITLRQLKLPVKVVVFNNGALGFVELEMKAAGLVNFGTDLEDPDFAAVASALGLYGQRVERPDDLAGALRSAFVHDGPALVDVVTARQELSIPPTVTFEQVKGFTLYATRTVLSGRGDELVDLAKTNVTRHLFAGKP